MQLSHNVNLAELQQYINDEREKEAKAARDARRAEIDRLLEELEERRTADAKAAAEKRAAEDPNARAAELLFRVLTSAGEWPAFIALVSRGSMKRLAENLTRIEGERIAGAKHREAIEAPAAREDAKQAVVVARKSKIEQQLASAGVLADVSDDD